MVDVLKKYYAGILMCFVVAIPAYFIGKAVPIVGAPVLGILFGMLLAFWKRPVILDNGIKFTSKMVLQYSIILLGFEMNLHNVLKVGQESLVLMIFTLSATFVCACFVGRALKIESKTTTLIGVGTAICGGSAIAATAPVIDANDGEVAHAISTIFLFNIIAAFLFPALGHLMNMDDTAFGMWAGTAINDTSSVVAAGYTFSAAAGDLAVIVKLTRTLMIIPITIVLALIVSAKRKKEGQVSNAGNYSFAKIFPWFVLGFVAAALINTFLPIGEAGPVLTNIGKFMIVMAMAAIGMNTNIVTLIKKGGKPILLGGICWIVLAVVSLLVQRGVGHFG